MYGETSRNNDPDWVYRSFLRCLFDPQLIAHEKWQTERVSAGGPEEVADARSRLELVAYEFRHRGLTYHKRNGHAHPSVEETGICSPHEKTDPGSLELLSDPD